MKITFLGVGSAFSRKHGNSNLLIEHEAIKLLLDCSRLGLLSLNEYGLSLREITHILITHLHADHIGGLEEVALISKFVHRRKVTLLTTETLLKRLWEHSMSGGLEYIEQNPGDSTPQTLEDFFLPESLTLPHWQFIAPNCPLRVRLHPTQHVQGMESYGVELEEYPAGGAKRIFVSGDTKFRAPIIHQAVQSCALVFHDCQLFNSGKTNDLGVHASYSQLLTLPPEIRKHLWLYHYGDTPLPDARADGFAGFVTMRQTFTL